MRTRQEQNVLRAFGEAVRKQRLKLDLSQEKLAELADLHRTYIADIERGTRNVGLINVVRVAEALGLSADVLLKSVSRKTRPA